MKKTLLFFAAAIFAIAAVSCNRIEQVPETGDVTVTPQRIPVTITATVQEDTKTTYAGGTTFSWTAGDKISVLTYNSSADTYKYEEFTASSTGASSSFTGSMDPGFALSSYALYPASDDHDYDPNDWAAIHFNIPKSKDCSSVATAELPMVATRTGDVFSFSHCSGAAKIVVDNIPEKYTSVTISFSSKSGGVKISGTFGIHDGGSGVFGWSSAYAEDANDRVFSRKVPVNSHSATLYIPFATGGTIYDGNTVTVTGHDGVNNDVIYSNTSVKSIGSFSRATVIPLTTLHMNNLKSINWSGSGISSFGESGYVQLWKAASDSYYIYFLVQVAASRAASGKYIYTGFNTNGTDDDGLPSAYGTGLSMDGDPSDMEALSLVFPFASVDATTITFKDGIDSEGFIQKPVKTSTGKVTTWGYQTGDLSTGTATIVFAIERSKIGSPEGTIKVQHAFDWSPSTIGTFTLN